MEMRYPGREKTSYQYPLFSRAVWRFTTHRMNRHSDLEQSLDTSRSYSCIILVGNVYSVGDVVDSLVSSAEYGYFPLLHPLLPESVLNSYCTITVRRLRPMFTTCSPV
jgi:hypothetical protein